MTGPTTAPPEQGALFTVAAGHPTDQEVAVLAAVLTAVRRARGRPHAPVNSAIAGGWRSHWHLVRHGMLQGHGAWRSTARR